MSGGEIEYQLFLKGDLELRSGIRYKSLINLHEYAHVITNTTSNSVRYFYQRKTRSTETRKWDEGRLIKW